MVVAAASPEELAVPLKVWKRQVVPPVKPQMVLGDPEEVADGTETVAQAVVAGAHIAAAAADRSEYWAAGAVAVVVKVEQETFSLPEPAPWTPPPVVLPLLPNSTSAAQWTYRALAHLGLMQQLSTDGHEPSKPVL